MISTKTFRVPLVEFSFSFYDTYILGFASWPKITLMRVRRNVFVVTRFRVFYRCYSWRHQTLNESWLSWQLWSSQQMQNEHQVQIQDKIHSDIQEWMKMFSTGVKTCQNKSKRSRILKIIWDDLGQWKQDSKPQPLIWCINALPAEHRGSMGSISRSSISRSSRGSSKFHRPSWVIMNGIRTLQV